MKGTGRILLLGLGFLLSAAAAKSAPSITITSAAAEVDYPQEITFTIEAESDAEIRILELEYGLTGRDCTPDVNVVIPEDFVPGKEIQVEWTWRVAASGNLPPGMQIWWIWRLVDDAGNEIRSEKQWLTWIDSIYDWKTLISENIFLHWYRGSEEYNRDFMSAAEAAREILRNDVGAWPGQEIHLYIYGSNQDMKDALVGEPDWIGGLSFGENQRTIIIGIDRRNEEWGKSTIAHELAHTAVDSIMGGCYATIPLWLNEGIAMYTEGDLDEEFVGVFADAVYYDSLFSLRSISYQYQYVDGDPTLTYAESYSVVRYLIEEYGNLKIHQLLQMLGEGYTYDKALLAAFGVDMDGLEDAWRSAIGADPMIHQTPPVSPSAMLQTTLPPSTSSLILSTLTPTPWEKATETPANTPSEIDLGDLIEFPGNVIALCSLGLLCVSGIGLAGLLLMLGRRKSAASKME